jgi:cell division protein FtsQ
MWDRPALLNAIANALFGVAFLFVMYALIVLVAALPVFPLREVRVLTAPKFVQRSDIEAVVSRELRGTFFTIDLARVRKGLEDIPWVRKADLRRRWPGRLEVELQEHEPLARWGSMGLVNVQGEIFDAPYQGRLPVFNGPAGAAKEMTIQYEYFRRSLEPIGREPVQVNVSPRRAWSLRLDSGLTLELGRSDLENRLARFVRNYERAVLTLGRRIDHADLRYPDGFAVRIPELARAEAKGKAR